MNSINSRSDAPTPLTVPSMCPSPEITPDIPTPEVSVWEENTQEAIVSDEAAKFAEENKDSIQTAALAALMGSGFILGAELGEYVKENGINGTIENIKEFFQNGKENLIDKFEEEGWNKETSIIAAALGGSGAIIGSSIADYVKENGIDGTIDNIKEFFQNGKENILNKFEEEG